MIRQTHTYAELEVSQAAFNEILGRIKEADPEQARRRLDFPTMILDLGGIGLVRADRDDEQRSASKQHLDAVYRERNLVVALAAKLALSHSLSFAWLGQDPEAEEGWRNVVFISLSHPFDSAPVQLSWHIPDSELGTFAFLPRIEPEHELQRAQVVLNHGVISAEWDGHTTEEKYRRILRFVGASS